LPRGDEGFKGLHISWTRAIIGSFIRRMGAQEHVIVAHAKVADADVASIYYRLVTPNYTDYTGDSTIDRRSCSELTT